MDKKKFQIINWEKSNFSKDKIVLKMNIFNKYVDLESSLKEKNYIIAIGYNPSNKTSFNDDSTNLYLRDKIKNKYPSVMGYILVNLIPKVETDSSNVGINDIDDDYIDEIIKLINGHSKFNIVLFFGHLGVNILNSKNDKMKSLKEVLEKASDRICYTSRPEDFIHPGRSADNFNLVDWKENLLDKK